MNESDQFFAQGAPAPDRVNGRYTWADPATGEVRSWQTASNFAYPLIDQAGLQRWRHRQILIGLSQRPDLMAVLAATVEHDNGTLDQMIETALQVAGTTKAANLGTAVHAALEAADQGLPYPDQFEPHVAAYRQALVDNGLTVLCCEARVINRPLGAAGKLDRIYQEADGSYVVGDVKTAGNLELGGHEHAVQTAVYTTSDYIRQGDEWVPMPPVRTDYAVIVHVNRETGATAVYRVSLTIGRHGANLAEEIRGWRKSGPVLLPYVPPTEIAPTTEVQGATRDPFAQVTEQSGIGTPFTRAAQPEIDQLNAANPNLGHGVSAAAQPEISGAGVPFPAVEPEMNGASNVSSSALAFARPADDSNRAPDLGPAGLTGVQHTFALRTAQDLLGQRITKAHVQEYARQVDPLGVGKDLAHNKKVLVEMLGKAGKLAAAGSVSSPAQTGPAPVMPAAASDTATFRVLTMARIKQATTVGDLQLLNRTVVKERGDQAWTDEMTEAARLRVAELDQPVEPTILDRITACTETDQLADLWNDVTVGGSVMAHWTPEVDQASRIRLAELNNSRPPAPANPFAS